MIRFVKIAITVIAVVLLVSCSQTPELEMPESASIVPVANATLDVSEAKPMSPPCSGDASCTLRDVSELSLLELRVQGAMSQYDTLNVETMLESGIHGLGASPAHIVVRGTPVDHSIRCAWGNTAMTNSQRKGAIRALLGIRPDQPMPTDSDIRVEIDAMVGQIDAQYRDAFRIDFNHLMDGGVRSDGQMLACFANFTISEYLLGTGAGMITVAYDGLAKTRSYELYKKAYAAGRYDGAPLQSAADYATAQQATITSGEKEVSDSIKDRESIMFLSPMAAHRSIGIESWQVIAQWDLQTKDGTVNAVRYGADPTEAEYSQTFANLKTRITKAAASDTHAGKRIANTSGLTNTTATSAPTTTSRPTTGRITLSRRSSHP